MRAPTSFRLALPALLLAVPLLALPPLLEAPAAASQDAAADAPPRTSPRVAPEPHHGLVVGIVGAGLSDYHYAGRGLDAEISACWFDSYLERLDPNHMYLTERDVAAFLPFRDKLHVAARSTPPDMGMPFLAHALFRERLLEHVAWQEQALADGPPDLSDPETLVLDRRELQREPDEAALRELWRRDLEDEWLREKLAWQAPEEGEAGGDGDGDGDGDGADDGAAPPTDAEIADMLRTRTERLSTFVVETEPSDVVQLWLGALASCYDPHSAYFAPMDAEDFEIGVSGSLEGIGASLNVERGYVTVQEVLAGGPADRSEAIHADDRIVGVAQGDGDWVDVVGMPLDHVVRLIRGPKGTTVRLQILSAKGVDGRKEISLVRDRIDLEAVEPTLSVETVEVDGTPVKVATIEVPAFVGPAEDSEGGIRPGTTTSVRRLLGELDDDVGAVVIDLRENGGGLLDQAVSLTGLFIDRGPVVQVRDGRGKVQVEEDQERGRAWDGPLAVLTSPASASASEIFAGAIQDYGRGVVVGASATYGKGSVQTVFPLDTVLEGMAPELAGKGGLLKLTYSMYYLPGGASTQAEGVSADVPLPMPGEGRIIREIERDHALPHDEIPAARFRAEGDLSTVVAKLRARSAERVASDDRLLAIRELNARLEQEAEDTTVSLQLSTRQAEQTAWREVQEAFEARIGEDEDPVLDEALRVAADLAVLGG